MISRSRTVLGVLALALALPVSATASGAPAPSPAAPSPAASTATPSAAAPAATCSIDVRGTRPDGRLQTRRWTGNRVVHTASTRARLPFAARDWSMYAAAGGPGSYFATYVVDGAGGRVLQVDERGRSRSGPNIRIDGVRTMLRERKARLHTYSGRAVYSVDGRGRILRRELTNRGSDLVLKAPKRIRGVRLAGARDVVARWVRDTETDALYVLTGKVVRQIRVRGTRATARVVARGVGRADQITAERGCRGSRLRIVTYDRSRTAVVVRDHRRPLADRRLGPGRRLPARGFSVSGIS